METSIDITAHNEDELHDVITKLREAVERLFDAGFDADIQIEIHSEGGEDGEEENGTHDRDR